MKRIIAMLLFLLISIPQVYAQEGGIDLGGGDEDVIPPTGGETNTVPEPGILTLFGFGAVGLGLVAYLRRKK